MKFKYRYLVLTIILVTGVFLIGGCIKSNISEPDPNAPADTEGGAMGVQEPAGGIGKMNEQIYIEITARNMYETEKNPQAWILTGFPAFLAKQGVSGEQFSAFSEQMVENPDNYMAMMQKIQTRYQELKAGK